MKFSSKERQFFYLTIFLVALFFADRFVFKPMAERLAKLEDEITRKEKSLLKGLRIEGKKENIFKEYKDIERYLNVGGSDEEITSELLREIERIGRETGISLSDIKPRSTQKRTQYREYMIEVRTESNMQDLIKFLYHLEGSNLLLRIQKLTLNLKEENSDVLKANMLISGISIL